MSCRLMRYEPKFTIGMAEPEFKRLNKSAMQVYADDQDIDIYRTYNPYGFYKFFGFSEAKLIKFKEGKHSTTLNS